MSITSTADDGFALDACRAASQDDVRRSCHAEGAKLALDRTLGFLREHVG